MDPQQAAAPGDPQPPEPTGGSGQEGAREDAGAPEEPVPAARGERSGWALLVPVMALGAGLLFGTSAALADGDRDSHPASLAELIGERNAEVEELSGDVSELQGQIAVLSVEGRPPARSQADQLAPSVGMAAVTGPAVQVVLDDAGYSLETLPEGYTVDDVVVHQQDVQAVVNALWAGGAEAMMIQDQRIISTSAVQCVGNTLYLQGRVYSPPYTITAIGDTEALTTALEADPTVRNYRAWADILGLGYAVSTPGEVEAPAFTGTVRPQHAQVLGPRPEPPPEDGPMER